MPGATSGRLPRLPPLGAHLGSPTPSRVPSDPPWRPRAPPGVTCPLPVSPPRREKDALWQKTEGIDAPAASPAPREAGLCARCHKDFRLLSRRYSCRWAPGDTRGHRGTPGDTGGHQGTRCQGGTALTAPPPLGRLCQGKVCHACSVDVGKQGRCCLLCYQQRHPAAT
ncbi:RUN and FYVE domain-containing protein 4 [Aix galericulata]|nr:RUN and FYVE domain-containing protein 4 [Aix galericulata]